MDISSLTDGFLFGPEPIVFIQDVFGQGHQGWFKAFSLIGDTWGVLFVVGLSLWLWGRKATYEVVLVIVLAAVLKELTNVFVGVPRPSAESIVIYESLKTPSFPSGHVMTAVAMWGLLYERNHIHIAVAALAAVLVSLGRLYVASHYLGDVLAGLAGGMILVWLFPRLWPPVSGWIQKQSFTRILIAAGAVSLGVTANLFINTEIPHRWGVTGMTLGLVAGLLIEYRRGLRAEHDPHRRRILTAIGIVGLAACYALNAIPTGAADVAYLVTTFVAGAWVAAGAPFAAARRAGG